MNLLSPQEIADLMQAAAGPGFKAARCTEWAEGVKARKSKQVWITMDKTGLRPALQRLVQIHYPHAAVIAFADTGDSVDLMYHLYVYWGIPHEEILVTFTVTLPKTDLTVPTITDIIPGILTSEREKQEMLGVQVLDIPDGRRIFLPEDFPEGVYPWRKDETGIPADMVKDLWATGRDSCQFKVFPPPEPAAAAASTAAPQAPPAAT
jgi:membrane-bound hydrogenase subunit beta